MHTPDNGEKRRWYKCERGNLERSLIKVWNLDCFLPPLGKIEKWKFAMGSKIIIIIIIASIKLSHLGKRNIILRLLARSRQWAEFTVQLKRTWVNNHADFIQKEKKLRSSPLFFYTLCCILYIHRREKNKPFFRALDKKKRKRAHF